MRVRGLFDTHRAATLLGWPKVGLADLVAERLGVTLDKAHQQSDFSLRPLPPEMRRYIADDVRYLTELGRLVSAAVVAADIVEEVQLDCERLTDEAAARPAVAPFAMKVSRTLPPADQAFQLGAALASTRAAGLGRGDRRADGEDAFHAAIQELVTRPPKDRSRCRARPGCRGRVGREHGDEGAVPARRPPRGGRTRRALRSRRPRLATRADAGARRRSRSCERPGRPSAG